MLYWHSNGEVMLMLCDRLNLPASSILGVVRCDIDRIDRQARKYYMHDGTEGDIPMNINLS